MADTEVVSRRKKIRRNVLIDLEHLLSEGHSFRYYDDLLEASRYYGYPGPASLIVIEYFFFGKSSREVADMIGMTSFPVRHFLRKKAGQFRGSLLFRGRGGPNNVKPEDTLQSDCN